VILLMMLPDDIFDVTLRNWGPCNPYDALNPLTSLDAVTKFHAYVSFFLPLYPLRQMSQFVLEVQQPCLQTRNGTDPTGILHWYNNSDLLPVHEVGTGTTYNPGALAAGVIIIGCVKLQRSTAPTQKQYAITLLWHIPQPAQQPVAHLPGQGPWLQVFQTAQERELQL
jgi:hypothetical protein